MDLKQGVFLDLATVDNGDLKLDALDRTLPAWRFQSLTAADAVAEAIGEADLAVTNKVPIGEEVMRRATHLKLIVLAATGANVVNLESARRRGVSVCNIRDYCSDSVAQHVLALMLNLVAGQAFYRERVRAGEWTASGRFSLHDRTIRELAGLSLGIIGYGAIGQATARLARAVGMNVLVGERRWRQPRADRLSFRDLVANADVVSVHSPLNEETRGMFDHEVFRQMKPDAILINTARGGIVHEGDLADALRAGEIGGAGVDVLSTEPPPPDHPLLADDIPNLVLTPHNAWASVRARQACIDQVADVIKSFQRGTPINRLV